METILKGTLAVAIVALILSAGTMTYLTTFITAQETMRTDLKKLSADVSGLMDRAKVLAALPLEVRRAVENLPTYYPDDYWKTLKGSYEEGRVIIVYSAAPEQLEGMRPEFNKKFPWIKVDLVSMRASDILPRFLTDIQAGQSTADVFMHGIDLIWMEQAYPKYVMKYSSPEGASYADFLVQQQKKDVGIYTWAGNWGCMAYNKEKVPRDMVPNSLSDLAVKIKKDPAFWKGKIVMYDVGLSIYGANWMMAINRLLGDQEFWSIMETIGSTKPALETTGTPMAEKTLAGEYLFSPMVGESTWRTALAKAPAAIEYLYAPGGIVASSQLMQLAANAKYPNAAKVWLDWCLSKEGQDAIISASGGSWFTYRTDIPAEKYSNSWKAINDKYGKTAQVAYWLGTLQEQTAFRERWMKLMRPS